MLDVNLCKSSYAHVCALNGLREVVLRTDEINKNTENSPSCQAWQWPIDSGHYAGEAPFMLKMLRNRTYKERLSLLEKEFC